MDASTNSSRAQHPPCPIPAKPPPCRGSGYAADPVDGEAILVEQVGHLAHEVDQVRRREVRIEVFPGNPILVEGEEPRVLDPLVEVVVAARIYATTVKRLRFSSVGVDTGFSFR